MRLLFTILLCCCIIGGTWAYTDFDNGIKRSAREVLYARAEGKTEVEIRRTFDCFDDSGFGEPAIKAMIGGRDAYVNTSKMIPANETIVFELKGVEVEQNSIVVFANADSPDEFFPDAPALRAMIVTVKYNRRVIAEKIFHSDAMSSSVGGSVAFEIPLEPRNDEGSSL